MRFVEHCCCGGSTAGVEVVLVMFILSFLWPLSGPQHLMFEQCCNDLSHPTPTSFFSRLAVGSPRTNLRLCGFVSSSRLVCFVRLVGHTARAHAHTRTHTRTGPPRRSGVGPGQPVEARRGPAGADRQAPEARQAQGRGDHQGEITKSRITDTYLQADSYFLS